MYVKVTFASRAQSILTAISPRPFDPPIIKTFFLKNNSFGIFCLIFLKLKLFNSGIMKASILALIPLPSISNSQNENFFINFFTLKRILFFKLQFWKERSIDVKIPGLLFNCIPTNLLNDISRIIFSTAIVLLILGKFLF